LDVEAEYIKMTMQDYFDLLEVGAEPELGTFPVFGGMATVTVYQDEAGNITNFMDLDGCRYHGVEFLTVLLN
jgi:hypothetical protein